MTGPIDPDRLAGLILAGGRSARMGRDKAMLEWRGISLLDRARGLLRSAGAGTIHVGGRPQEADGLPDSEPQAGPARAILDAARALHPICDTLLVIPVDMPLLQAEHLTALLRGAPGRARHWQGQPLPALIPVSARLRQGEDIHSIKWLLARLGAEALELPPLAAGLPDPFTNINTREAFARLEQ
jgi:molybdopterin-guanine dinucleotide biosynthesis protein A